MSEELLPYYHRELAFLRKMGSEFAQANPKIAGRLRWAGDMSEDPHVSRLIEGFAFLTARIRHKIDDDFPELTEALLGVLYPHYLSPLPSASIIQLKIDPMQAKLIAGYRVARGATVETEPIEGQPCRFRTVYDTHVWPIEITQATYQAVPFVAPPHTVPEGTEAVLRVRIRAMAPEVKLAQIALQSLRLFLHGQGQFTHDLYELLLNNVVGVAIAANPSDPHAVVLDGVPRPVGFELDEGLYDYTARSFPGYRLLTEYFAFPEKFLFVDLPAPSPEAWQRVGQTRELEFLLFLNRHRAGMEQQVQRDSLRLGCTPMVNLYKQRCEPIRWRHTHAEYRIVPDARRPAAHEIYQIDRVRATSPQREELEFTPFYSTRHAFGQETPRAFWHAARRRSDYAAGQIDRSTEVYLSLVDLDFQPAHLADWTIDVEATCLNRNLPGRLEFGGGRPTLQLAGGGPLSPPVCLTPPTPTYRPALRQGTAWRLVSHLSLNHLSLVDGPRGAEALRELLRLYDPVDSKETRTVIEGLLDARWRRVVGRVTGGAAAGFCRGVEVTLHFDEDRFAGQGIFLLSAVLERFLGLYCTLNSFTQTVITSRQRPGTVRKWPPRAGQQVLI